MAKSTAAINIINVVKVLTFIVIVVECKRSKSSRKSQSDHSGTITGLYFCAFALLLCFLPSLFLFFYNVIKDPITPKLIGDLMAYFKTNTLGFLSTKIKQNTKEKSG